MGFCAESAGSCNPEGACACGAEEHMASIGPPALGAKGCVERLRPTGETTHYDLCVAGAPANHVRCASLRSGGRRLAVRKMIEYQIGALPRTPFPAAREFPSRGNERYEEKNRGVICFMYYSSISPFSGWRHHLSAPLGSMSLDSQSPTAPCKSISLATTSWWDYGCLAMGPCLYRKA